MLLGTYRTSFLVGLVLACLTGCVPHYAKQKRLTSRHQSYFSVSRKKYGSLKRGSYQGSHYKVQNGDTLYFIAYMVGKDIQELISYNKLTPPYIIHPGDQLRLFPLPKPVTPKLQQKISPVIVKAADRTNSKKERIKLSSAKKTKKQEKISQKLDIHHNKTYVDRISNSRGNNLTQFTTNEKIKKWIWPTQGRVISKFSQGDFGNKGIDIVGWRGQSVIAAANGTVMYSGNALRGYGNLIIIKHNEQYLSAYAHNNKLLIKGGEIVKIGQKIAEMGSSGTNNVKLHFEIRYKGKSVNPQHFLP